MNEQLIYCGMADIMQRIIQLQTDAEQLTKPASQEEMLKMLNDTEASAAWLRGKLFTPLTDEERAAYKNVRRPNGWI